MEQNEVLVGGKTLDRYSDLLKKILSLKYLFLTIVESHSIKEDKKMSFKEEILEIADTFNQHFTDLRYKKISRFNLADVERTEKSFVKSIRYDIYRAKRLGLRLIPKKVNLNKIVAGEREIDERLVNNRIYEEAALEKTRLDQLNSLQSYLKQTLEPKKEQTKPALKREDRINQDLFQMKIKTYQESFTKYESQYTDLLYQVKTKIDKCFRDGTRISIHGGNAADSISGLNHNELCIFNRDSINYSYVYKEKTTSFLLDLHLFEMQKSTKATYYGRISGWVEAGVNRVEFYLEDSPRLGSNDSLHEERDMVMKYVQEFLSKAEFDNQYSKAMKLCEEKSKEQEHHEIKIEQEMKEKASEALDRIL